MKKKYGNYYLGLDIGTNSVGWAVTDEKYNILKSHGKAMWGIRLFEEGKTAEERRLHRSARRRQDRKVQRIKLLQELFAEEIAKADPGFYLRLEESKFWSDDKTVNQRNTLFNDKNYKDRDFYREYPTIYHLRKALIEGKKEFDVRLVYLGIHHILKKRGHFLFEGKTTDAIADFEEIFADLKRYCKEENISSMECEDIEILKNVLKDTSTTITSKKSQLNKLLDAETKQEKALFALLAGATVKLSELYNDDELNSENVTKICFKNGAYDEKQEEVESILGERAELIQKAKIIYDWAILEETRKGERFLSMAKVKSYEEHKKDLYLLKQAIKEYCPEKYKLILSDSSQKNNYAAYVGNSNGEKIKRCIQEDLCKFLEKIFKDYHLDESYNNMIFKIKNRTFLPKQITGDNSVIPYQLNKQELHVILENASKYLTFLNEIDDTGFSVSEKIEKILEFRIPYYVGPLNDQHKDSGNCWIKKKQGMENEKILPWNFEKIVDRSGSAERFIRKMTNKCTYLIGADVLPKNSLLYSRFMLLNELNNIKINKEPIKTEIKNRAIDDLFKKHKKVTIKNFKKWLYTEVGYYEDAEITGIDGDFKASLASYIDFQKILGKMMGDEMVEELILWIVLFGDDKTILKQRIIEKYSDQLTEKEIQQICKLKYSGWGRLSRELLTEIYIPYKETGEKINIISMMQNYSLNMMQLLSRKYGFIDGIQEYNQNQVSEKQEISIDMLDDLYVSPAIKRSVWQTLQIVKEIEKVIGHEPKRIFIEMARGGEINKTRKSSRKNKLLELYENHEEDRDWIEEIGSRDESDYRSDRRYLYYTQMGRCMYSGEKIPLKDLYKKNIYDIDHIYPRSKVKDDSLDNRVLVKRQLNKDKGDDYPISPDIQKERHNLWKTLLMKNFISKKKYERLTRKTEFSDDELADFISRQVVETRQSTKAVANILKRQFEDSEIVYVKAGNVADFRHDKKMIKVREVNDYHHAKDAYLNIVVGNVYFTKFTKDPRNFLNEPSGKNYSMKRIYDFDVIRNGEVAWKRGKTGTIATVRKVMQKNNILFTRYATENKGGFFDQMPVKAGKGQMPLKTTDERLKNIERYGGYNKISGAYFSLIEHEDKKGKRIRTIEYVPVYMAEQFRCDKGVQKEYCTKNLGLKNPKILIPKIKINTLFEVDGFRMHLTGRTGAQLIFQGAMQLVLGEELETYLKKVCKIHKQNPGFKISEWDGITKEQNLLLYDTLLSKLENTKYKVRLSAQIDNLKQAREKFIKLSLEKQSEVLYQELFLFACNVVTADLSLIGGSKYSGKTLISNKMTNYTEAKIIHQSITGLFENEVDLLKL